MAIKAVFKVDEVLTKVDKPIPFTNEVIKAGTKGTIVSEKYSKTTYILKFSEDFMNWLYLEYDISDISIKGTLESINIHEEDTN